MAKTKQPQPDPSIRLRIPVRETMKLNTNASRPWTLQTLIAQLASEYSGLEEGHVKAALQWLQERGFVDYKWNTIFEREDWYLTERGRAST